MCASVFDVLSLSSLPPQKVGDNYRSKKADYQSRLTTSRQAELLHSLSSPQTTQKRRRVTQLPPWGPGRLSTQLLSVSACLGRLLVFCHLMCLFEAAMQPGREGCACCSQLLPLLHCSPGERVSKRGKVGPFLVLHLTLPQITAPRCQDNFCSAILFYHFSKGLTFISKA